MALAIRQSSLEIVFDNKEYPVRTGFRYLVTFTLCLLLIGNVNAADQPQPISKSQQLTACKFECVNPRANDPESAQVIEAVQKFLKAYVTGDYQTCEDYTDDDCTTFDEGDNRIIVGKAASLEDMKHRMERNVNQDSPLESYTVRELQAKLTGNVAVVTFVAVRTFGGKFGHKDESRCSDIFVKRGDKWKLRNYRSDWRSVN
jgi:ketosteroid isomerase-like protein